MRVNGAFSAFLSVCVLALISTLALADDAHKATSSSPKRPRGVPSPARPSGIPFTPVLGSDRARAAPRSGGAGQRPDLVSGCSLNPVLGGAEVYFDVNCFSLPAVGTFGDVPRNTITGPGFASWDMAFFKNIPFAGGRRIQLRVEGFNLTNRVNFGLPQTTVFNASGRVANAGQITSIVGTARQWQFGAKVEF